MFIRGGRMATMDNLCQDERHFSFSMARRELLARKKLQVAIDAFESLIRYSYRCYTSFNDR